MNYLEYIKNTFYLYSNDGKHVCCYLEDTDNTIIEFEFALPNNSYYYNYGAEELNYYVANYVNRNAEHLSTLDLIGYSVGAYEDMYYISTNKVDFVEFTSSIYSYSVSACRVNDQVTNATYDDYYIIENYSKNTSDGVFNYGNNLGSYNKEIDSTMISYFDYTNLYYENGDYKQDVNVIRGENVSFYNVYFWINGANGDNVYVGYGNPYSDYYNQGYQTGYGNGYSQGFVNGQDIGYQNGVNSSGQTPQEATAFTYIGNAFQVVSNVMSLEVLPHMTLGLVFSIPLVLVLIMTIFKLVRK